MSALGYMSDIKLYPAFHQLSEDESSSNTLQSDPGVRTHAYMLIKTHSGRRADAHAGHHSSEQNLNAAFH